MSLFDFFILLLVAGLVGGIGQSIAGYSHGGCLASIAIGFIGALLGTWIARVLRLPDLFLISTGTTTFPVIWSVVGSTLFVAILGRFSRRPPARAP